MAIGRRILIIGSGFGGLGLGIRLTQRGVTSFTILEKASDLGGTWRDNQYPGAACDVPSMLYSLSFAPKSDWSRKWSPAPEIHAYMEDVARREDLLSHVRFGVEVTGARFDERTATWTVRTAAGEEYVAEVLVTAVGQLHRPALPSIPGRDGFRGVSFHSARWNHGVDLAGKRVGVIGNAASAIQFIPPVAARCADLTIFQRSANWMIPRNDHPYGPTAHWLFAHVPGLVRLYRAWLWALAEVLLLPVMRRRAWACRFYAWGAQRYLRSVIADPALRATLTPDYPIGGKRILISDDYYPALLRDNVHLVTDPIARIDERGVVTADGRRHDVDVLVYATGFHTNPFLAPMRIEGLGGRVLADDWAQGERAFHGITVAGYPNFFMLYGPNTNLGHNSIIFMLECQIAHVLSVLDLLGDAGAPAWVDVRREVMDAFNRELDVALQHTAWAATEHSWYKNAAGRITNNWPHSTLRYWWQTRRAHPRDYHVERVTRLAVAHEPAAPQPVSA